MSDVQPLDHIQLGLSRVITQYKEASCFLAYLRALSVQAQEIETLLHQLALQVDIDQAQGVQLDVLGSLVGISRQVPHAIGVAYFGFADHLHALSFGEEGQPHRGGRFRDELEPADKTSVLADVEYRQLIRAKIIKNHARGTPEDILRSLRELLGNIPLSVQDNGGMAVQLGIGRKLSVLEKALLFQLDILPRPAGVRISASVTFEPQAYFGFHGQPGALGLGEEDQPNIGGPFAEEF